MISEKFIYNKIAEYAKTKNGKKKIKQKYGVVLDDDLKISTEINNQIFIMKEILLKHISTISDKFTMAQITSSKPFKNENGVLCVKIEINKDALRRESLYPEGYPDGLEDILLLFSNGYTARDYVYNNSSNSRYKISRIHRDPDDFLLDAVDEFNALYDEKRVKASLDGKYKK